MDKKTTCGECRRVVKAGYYHRHKDKLTVWCRQCLIKLVNRFPKVTL